MSASTRDDARISVLIADDHAMVRAGLRMIVEDEDDMLVVGEAEGGAPAGEIPAATPALLLANFSERDIDTLLDRCREAKVDAPLKAVATKTNRTWRFDALLAHLAEERAAYAAAAAEK